MPAKRDPEIDALETVYGALKSLDPDVRTKVLKGVYALLGILDVQPEARASEVQSSQTTDRTINRDSSSSSQLTDATSGLGGRQKSLMELILEKPPKTNIERIVLFAYYR